MMQLRRSFLVMTVSALLAACGGGGGDSSNDSAQPENNLGSQPTETTTIVSAGQFVDAPVVGLRYQTETQSGETDQYGRFSFIKGETVSFYIGDQLLGSAIAKNTVTPLDLVPESKRFVDSLEVSNILRLLQTLDVDTTDDVIELTAATHQAFIGTSYDLTLPFDSALEQQLAQVTIQQPNGAQQLVSAADAQAHFVETLQQFTVKPEYDFDTDGDGIGNKQDPDDDNDGIADEDDTTPQGGIDTDLDGIENDIDDDDDNDGVLDINDVFPLDKDESADTDSDGIGNNADADDDNDGVEDSADAFPLNYAESVDTDGDGIGNIADIDDDNDGVEDDVDVFPLNHDESVDTDDDGIGNTADTDDDNDGVIDVEDAFPLNKNESVDTDGDGIGNNADTDDDNDGVIDTEDDLPLNKDETVDTDGDGIGNNQDIDDDNDGVIDTEDDLPLNKDETVDTDGDGIGNNADTDDDNDGVSDAEDEFPLDKNESVDTDGDGIGNNADTDDDNDGVTDAEDVFPLDKNESVDTDGDGIGNNQDIDDDNDGVIDVDDPMPLDTDNDGLDNLFDSDDDNDGISDAEDAFPLNSNESVDTDLDGIGNNEDQDDDNDSIEDMLDAFPLDSTEFQDSDLDGIGNNKDAYPKDSSIVLWEQRSGDRRNSKFVELNTDVDNFNFLWESTFDTINGMSPHSLVASAESLFTVMDRNLVAISVVTGKLQWEVSLSQHTWVNSPSYYNGVVYVVGGEGENGNYTTNVVYAFNAFNGAEIFKFQTSGIPIAGHGALLLDENLLYVSKTDAISAYNAHNGEEVWNDVYPSNGMYLVIEGNSLFSYAQDKITEYDKKSGVIINEITSFYAPRVWGVWSVTPVIGAFRNFFINILGERFSVYNLDDLNIMWSLEDQYVQDQVAVDNRNIYMVNKGVLEVRDQLTGEIQWSWSVPPEDAGGNELPLNGDIIVTEKQVFLTGTKFFVLDKKSHQMVWSALYYGHMILSNGVLYFSNLDRIVAIDVEGDRDSDGLPDWWERIHSVDLNPDYDNDNDGLTSFEEYQHGTKPLVADSDEDGISDGEEVKQYSSSPLNQDSDEDNLNDYDEVSVYLTDPTMRDSDADGLDDFSEILYMMDPLNNLDVGLDNDQDGVANIFEVLSGTDINDDSLFPILRDWTSSSFNEFNNIYQPVSLEPDSFLENWSLESGKSDHRLHLAAEGKLYYVSMTSLLALDSKTGSEIWKVSTDIRVNSLEEAMLYADGMLYILAESLDSDLRIYAFDAETGELLFSNKVGINNRSYYYQSTQLYLIESQLFAYDNSGLLYVLDAKTGQEYWSVQLDRDSSSKDIVIHDNKVIMADQDGIRIMNAKNGELIRIIDSERDVIGLHVGVNNSLIARFNRGLLNYDIDSGNLIWGRYSHSFPRQKIVSTSNSVFCVENTSGRHQVVALNAVNGKLVWTWEASGDFLDIGLLTSSHLFVYGERNTFAININSGSEEWNFSFSPGGYSRSNFVVNDSGNLFIQSAEKTISISLLNNSVQ